jgi:hypothetical protein
VSCKGVGACICLVAISLSACHGDGRGTGQPTYTIGGTLSGLGGGQQVTLHDNGSDALTATTNGAFIFKAPIANNGSYSVTVNTQPTGQVCTVSNGLGTGMTANVTNITITCVQNIALFDRSTYGAVFSK